MSDEFNEILARQSVHELDTMIAQMCVHESAARRFLSADDPDSSEAESQQVGMIYAGMPLGGLLALNLRTIHLLNVERENLILALSDVDRAKQSVEKLMTEVARDVRVPAPVMNAVMNLDAALEKILADAPYKKVDGDDE